MILPTAPTVQNLTQLKVADKEMRQANHYPVTGLLMSLMRLGTQKGEQVSTRVKTTLRPLARQMTHSVNNLCAHRAKTPRLPGVSQLQSAACWM